MNTRIDELSKDWKIYVALLTGILTFLSQFVGLITNTRLPAQVRWLIGAVLLIITVYLFFLALSKRSLLLEPKRFLLSPDNPDDLVGREQEVRHIAGQCAEHALVFLIGDSGCGKTALIRAGLAHGLR